MTRDGLLMSSFAANTCRAGQRLWLWYRNLKNQIVHSSKDWREEDHTSDATMRKIKGLQEQGRANEAVRNQDDRLPVEM
jgi:hypothetical protein